MEVEVGVEELRQRKLMVCTPMYGGMCAGTYTKSSTDLATVAAKYKCQHIYHHTLEYIPSAYAVVTPQHLLQLP